MNSCIDSLVNAIKALVTDLETAGVLCGVVFHYKVLQNDLSMENRNQVARSFAILQQNADNFKERYLSNESLVEETEADIKPSTEQKPDVALAERDPKLVQIRVDRSEINRRINAFILRKRKEVDEWNVQEFCSHPSIDESTPDWEHQFSCARVDAVFVPRSGSKSHVKVSKVVNQWGPQTRCTKVHTDLPQPAINMPKQSVGTFSTANQMPIALEERLKNMESHLKLKSSSISQDIHIRLKQLENRILFLEGLSPDYFTTMSNFQQVQPKNITTREDHFTDWNLTELNNRIQSLKDMLRQKSRQEAGAKA